MGHHAIAPPGQHHGGLPSRHSLTPRTPRLAPHSLVPFRPVPFNMHSFIALPHLTSPRTHLTSHSPHLALTSHSPSHSPSHSRSQVVGGAASAWRPGEDIPDVHIVMQVTDPIGEYAKYGVAVASLWAQTHDFTMTVHSHLPEGTPEVSHGRSVVIVPTNTWPPT